jgi:hypothetical protein
MSAFARHDGERRRRVNVNGPWHKPGGQSGLWPVALCDAKRKNAHIHQERYMTVVTKTGNQGTTGKAGPRQRRSRLVAAPSGAALAHVASFESAKEAGLLDGERTTHVSFRAPPALVEAAMKESGVTSPSELGMLALAALAQPDPVAAFLRRNRGRLSKGHKLDY